ncbi:MAG: transposase [Kiritimatiellae bacterium]|nr:transposase [Kiritimatiellia bacterium]
MSAHKARLFSQRLSLFSRNDFSHHVRGVPADSPVRADEIGEFHVFQAGRRVKRRYRRITVWREDKQEELVILTNNLHLAASTIAQIYKARWQIELFFRDLKQNLRIKTFVGTSANAVYIQIWTALIAILLIKYLQFKSKCGWHLSNLVALLRLNLFTYRDLWVWIERPYETPPLPPPFVQAEFWELDLGQQNPCPS